MTSILLVEDNEMNRDMISRRLIKRGFAVSMAVDGEQGIEKARNEKPDLILMDLSLPKIDGWEAARRLKAGSDTRAIPIIALTAHAMSGDREKALEAGCNEYDTKPVDFTRLMGKINGLLALTAAAGSPTPAPKEENLQDEATPSAPSPIPPTAAGPTSPAPAADPAEKAPSIPVSSPDQAAEEVLAVSLAKAMVAEAKPAREAKAESTEIGTSPAPLAQLASPTLARHLLIVDDNENNRDLLSRRFEKQGYLTETAASGEDALELIAHKRFDAVLLDIMMPGLDGVEVLRQIRKKWSLVELPVIMVTAKSEREDLVNALEAGANDYVPKPVDFLIALARIRTQLQLKDEHSKSERLLLNILPKLVADMLKRDSENFAERYSEATVMFADIVGFTQISAGLEPKALVRLLNEIFSAFDDLATKYSLEKIKTMGDGYMVVGGVPIPRLDHADAIALMALEMRQFITDFNRKLTQPLGIRIGIATGPVVAGVIGKSKFTYDLWGDTVNIASRMESHSQNGMIQINRETAHFLDGKFNVKKRGTIEVKGKGQMETFFLIGKNGA